MDYDGERLRDCDTKMANAGADLRDYETEMATDDANLKDCESQMDNDIANSRDCDTQMANDGADMKDCEAQMVNDVANSRGCETRKANGGADMKDCETQMANNGADMKDCETQMVNDFANLRNHETQMANDGADMNNFETQMVNDVSSLRECETQMANDGSNFRDCEAQMVSYGADMKDCETQTVNDVVNSRDCETLMVNDIANLRNCETQMAIDGADMKGFETDVVGLRECETQMVDVVGSRECETQMANDGSNFRDCEGLMVSDGADMKDCETRTVNDFVNSRDCETLMVDNGVNSKDCETLMANGCADLRACESQMTNDGANSRICSQIVNKGVNSSDFETQMANNGVISRNCENQKATSDANSEDCETQMVDDGSNSRDCETQMVIEGANSRDSETQITNENADSRNRETQLDYNVATLRVCETQKANSCATSRVRKTEMANSGANSRDCETPVANSGAKSRELRDCETQMVNGGTNSTDGLRTYKRRKFLKSSAESQVLEDGKACMNFAGRVSDKTTKEPVEKVFDNSSSYQVLPRLDSNSFSNGLVDSSAMHGRELLLKEMYQSLSESEGGIRECIQNAIVSRTENGFPSTTKDHHCSGEERQRLPFGHVAVASNGSLNDSNIQSNTELCKHVFFDILISEKFTELCNLIFRSFHGGKPDRILDVSVINSRINEGAYESSPMLFHSDIQQVWTRLQNVGNDMAALGKSLSDNTMAYCEKNFAQESNKPANRVCTCRHCGKKSDGENCLVCDSCEEMYHISCINPPIEEVPLVSWYCTNCVSKGADRPHEDCALCERLNAPRSPVDGILVSEDESEEDGQKWACCNICKNGVKTSQKYRTCGHLHCANKYYHDSCLTTKQLGIYASCWYCPSCLCRSCLVDKDDDKIVMCDGCDHAYHIYCMQPPCDSIPEGKWFCTKCDAGIERIRKAKMAYEQNKLKSKDLEGKGEEVSLKLDKSGGVDMLLTAAKTLSNQENLEESRKKR